MTPAQKQAYKQRRKQHRRRMARSAEPRDIAYTMINRAVRKFHNPGTSRG